MEDAGSGGQDDIADMVDGDSGRGATENGFGEGTSSAEAAGGTDPAQLRSKGEQTASSFWRCCQDRGLTAFCDALTFSGLRDELPRLAEPGITVLAPTNEAFAQLSDSARADQRLVRQLLLLCAFVFLTCLFGLRAWLVGLFACLSSLMGFGV